MLRVLTPLAAPVPVTPPLGLVFSSNPQKVTMLNEGDYVVKGPATAVTFSEAVAYAFAKELCLAVPGCGLCWLPGQSEPYFCSKMLPGRFSIEALGLNSISNASMVSDTIAFDIWIANTDRNLYNFVTDAIPSDDGSNSGHRHFLYAIDFEKSKVLRGEVNRFTIHNYPESEYWPSGQLGSYLDGQILEYPTEMCNKISSLSDEKIRSILEQVRIDMRMADINWLDSAVFVLCERAGRIHDYSNEVWNG